MVTVSTQLIESVLQHLQGPAGALLLLPALTVMLFIRRG